jgi:HNH endonuclease
MAFSDFVKLGAKRRAEFRCCVCHRPFVEVHHIVPISEGGADTLENAAPLCSACHDLYGGNPDKRKQIRQQRDHWWSLMAKRAERITRTSEVDDVSRIECDLKAENKLRDQVVAVYHVVLEHEAFETAAETLWKLIAFAQERRPGQPRHLFLDIEGHRRQNGFFDHDMWELQRHFVLGPLFRYLKRACMPVVGMENPHAQRNDIPLEIQVLPRGSPLQAAIANSSGSEIYVGDADTWITVDEGD